MIMVRMRHVRKLNYCSRAARDWFKTHNLNYTEFLQQGIEVTIIESKGDAIGLQVAQVAREEAAENEVSHGR